jgi:CRP-like cAMP-binding protein
MDQNKGFLTERLQAFSELTANDIAVSLPLWTTRKISKGDYFNMQNIVCTDLGLVIKGVFRIYYIDAKTQEERNVFFFSEDQFIVSFRSFLHRMPCYYYIQALEDSEIIAIRYHDLTHLYATYKPWERFGRQIAELFFEYSQSSIEDQLFSTVEDRYVKLMEHHPKLVERIPLYHISSFLNIKNPSLSRIRKRLEEGKRKK